MRLGIPGLLLAGIVITGCATGPITNMVPSSTIQIERPDKGVVHTGNIGDALVESGYKNTFEGIDVLQGGCVGECDAVLNCNYRIIIPDQTAALNQQLPSNKRPSSNRDAMCAVLKMRYVAATNCGAGEHLWFACKDGDSWFSPDMDFKQELEVKALFRDIEIVDKSFVQEFIYNGRYENNLRFIYREFSNDSARPAFTQEVQYDLDGGAEIGFKDLLIEVVNASNTSISYKVIRPF